MKLREKVARAIAGMDDQRWPRNLVGEADHQQSLWEAERAIASIFDWLTEPTKTMMAAGEDALIGANPKTPGLNAAKAFRAMLTAARKEFQE